MQLEKYQEWLKQMTLEEKVSLFMGRDFWHTVPIERIGIPSIKMTDGPHGLRVQENAEDNLGDNVSQKATCFPTEATISNSWDTQLVFAMGEALAQEAIEQGVDIVLGPGVNIKRSPLCGRNFEYFSEDPYLTAQLGIAYVKGMQSKQVGACVKHFAANNQEKRRRTINAVVDERALREIYLYAFEKIVKEAKPWAIMSAYNRLNGSFCSENKRLLDLLRKEWQFDGIVITDWGASNNRVRGLLAGNELEMPGKRGHGKEEIIQAVKEGRISESYIDICVSRVLKTIEKAKQTDTSKATSVNWIDKHYALAQKIAEESIVLLKNEEEILPLKIHQKIVVIGDMACHPRYQGAGSSKVNPYQIDNALTAFKQENVEFVYAQGYTRTGGKEDAKLQEEAKQVSRQADVVVVFAGLTEAYETEGSDRKNIYLPENQEELIEKLLAVNTNVVVVLAGGAPIAMPWKERVKAIITGYLGGEAGATAMVHALIGKVNPSGKLAESYPYVVEDTPCYRNFPGTEVSVEYQESIFVGYRYYITRQKEVLFPFGYGLSYTNFKYLEMTISKSQIDKNEKLKVSCKIQNVGNRKGKEILQVYIRQENPSVYKPKRELKAFQKVELEVGEVKTIEWELEADAFSYYQPEVEKWVVETGTYWIEIAKSSQQIELTKQVTVFSDDPVMNKPYPKVYQYAAVENVTDQDFEQILGHKIPSRRLKAGEFSEENSIEQMRHTWLGRVIYGYQKKTVIRKLLRKKQIREATRRMQDMQKPLKKVYEKDSSLYNEDRVKGFIQVLNGKWITGIKQIRKGRRKRRKEDKNNDKNRIMYKNGRKIVHTI